MTTVCGRYVATFAEASHALPDGMHMNADYPFMLPRITKIEQRGRKRFVTLSNGSEEAAIMIAPTSPEFGYLEQSSTFERMFGRKPHRFKMRPFKDNSTPAIAPIAVSPHPDQTSAERTATASAFGVDQEC